MLKIVWVGVMICMLLSGCEPGGGLGLLGWFGVDDVFPPQGRAAPREIIIEWHDNVTRCERAVALV